MAKRGRPKLWENCSKEEKEEIEAIETQRLLLKEDYERGYISYRKFVNKINQLIKKVDEVEAKYED